MGTGEYKTYLEEKNESKKPMTNADKYLKDGANVEELAEKLGDDLFTTYKIEEGVSLLGITGHIKIFLKAEATPTLTEDERVILRNINNMCKTIYREKYTGHIRTTLYCPQPDGLCGEELRCFDNLFQFIKERRRI